MRRWLIVVAFAAVLSTSAGATAAAASPLAGDAPGFFDQVILRIDTRLATATSARKPILKPPTPVRVKWRARRVSSVDLHAPLLDLVAADIDGDGKSELIALTTREVVVLKRRRRRKIIVLTRATLPGTAATIRPRLSVGALSVGDTDGDGALEIYVRSSELAGGTSFVWKTNKLEPAGSVVGFPVCPGVSAELRPGRHVFMGKSLKWPARHPLPTVPESFYVMRCGRGLVDTTGRALGAFALLDTASRLAVYTWSPCGAQSPDCTPGKPVRSDVRFVGTAFVLGDIDHDGHPEVIAASSRARGDADRVSVYSARRSHKRGAAKRSSMRRIYKRSFSGGVVGVAAGDIDGDGHTEAVVAVRLLGSQRVDLWVLN